MDQCSQNVCLITGQSIIGAQDPIGEASQTLQMKITCLNVAADIQTLSSHSIGDEVNNIARAGTATGETAPPALSTSSRICHSTTPLPPCHDHHFSLEYWHIS